MTDSEAEQIAKACDEAMARLGGTMNEATARHDDPKFKDYIMVCLKAAQILNIGEENVAGCLIRAIGIHMEALDKTLQVIRGERLTDESKEIMIEGLSMLLLSTVGILKKVTFSELKPEDMHDLITRGEDIVPRARENLAESAR